VSCVGWVRVAIRSAAGDHGHPLEVVGEDPQPDPGLGAGQAAQAGAAQAEAALEVADPGLDPDLPVARPSERSGPFELPPRCARVPVRCSPMRWTPRSATAWSLAAVPNPRSATTVPGSRPVLATTRVRWCGWPAPAGQRRLGSRCRPLPRWSPRAACAPRSSLASASLPRSIPLSCSIVSGVSGPARRTSLTSVVGCGTGWSRLMRQNRRQPIGSSRRSSRWPRRTGSRSPVGSGA
jgi:hypothetical protein